MSKKRKDRCVDFVRRGMWDHLVLSPFPHTQIFSIQQVSIYEKMNMGVLDENMWNSFWFTCSSYLVVLLHDFGLFLGLIYKVLSILMISVWRKIQSSLGGLELKIEEQKSKNLSDKTCGAALVRAPEGGVCPSKSGAPRLLERQDFLETPSLPIFSY